MAGEGAPPVEPEPLPVIAPIVEATVAVDVPQIAEIETIVAPAVAPPPPEPVDLDKALAESGLVLIQTTATAPILVEEPPVRLGRPRKPKAATTEANEPLVMVETGK
jgi:ribonuclease E